MYVITRKHPIRGYTQYYHDCGQQWYENIFNAAVWDDREEIETYFKRMICKDCEIKEITIDDLYIKR